MSNTPSANEKVPCVRREGCKYLMACDAAGFCQHESSSSSTAIKSPMTHDMSRDELHEWLGRPATPMSNNPLTSKEWLKTVRNRGMREGDGHWITSDELRMLERWLAVPPTALPIVPWNGGYAIRPTAEAADAFWKYWRENGETHKHGYYESTWGAINQALRAAVTKTEHDPDCVRMPGHEGACQTDSDYLSRKSDETSAYLPTMVWEACSKGGVYVCAQCGATYAAPPWNKQSAAMDHGQHCTARPSLSEPDV